jgi:hypothetical protein
MSLQRLARRVVRRYGTDITGLVGGNLNGATFKFGNTDVGETSGQQVTFSKDWWSNADQRDRRGALIHELTHVATRNQNLGGDAAGVAWANNGIEQGADAVRYALVGAHGINQDTLGAAQHIARQSGWLGDNMGTGNGGPPNGNGRRKRDTLANNASKSGGYTAPLSLGSGSQYSGQLAQARYDYLAQLAKLRQEVGLAKATKQQQFAVARTQRISDTSSAANAAADRGVYGSSIDMSGRAAAVSGETEARASAMLALQQAKLGAQSGALDARSGYYSTVSQVQAAMAADRAANTINAFQNDTFDARQLNYEDIRQAIIDAKRGDRPRQRRGAGADPYYGPAGNDRGPQSAGGNGYLQPTPPILTPWGKPLPMY